MLDGVNDQPGARGRALAALVRDRCRAVQPDPFNPFPDRNSR